MKITNAKYMERRSHAPYAHKELEISIQIEKDEDPIEEVKSLKGFIYNALYDEGEFCVKVVAPVEKKMEIVPSEKLEKTQAESTSNSVGKKTSSERTIITKKDKEAAAKTTEPEQKAEEVKAPVVGEKKEEKVEVKETKAEGTEAKAEPKKRNMNKNTAYDRALDTHKALLSQILDTEIPGWDGDDRLEKAVAASKSMIGIDFLDDQGNVLDSFKKSLLAKITA